MSHSENFLDRAIAAEQAGRGDAAEILLMAAMDMDKPKPRPYDDADDLQEREMYLRDRGVDHEEWMPDADYGFDNL